MPKIAAKKSAKSAMKSPSKVMKSSPKKAVKGAVTKGSLPLPGKWVDSAYAKKRGAKSEDTGKEPKELTFDQSEKQ